MPILDEVRQGGFPDDLAAASKTPVFIAG